MAQTRKNGKRAVGKRGNSGRKVKVTLKKHGRRTGGGVKKIRQKHSVKKNRKSSGGKKTVKRVHCGGRRFFDKINNTLKRQGQSFFDVKTGKQLFVDEKTGKFITPKRNTWKGRFTKIVTTPWQIGRTAGQYVSRGTFPDLNYTNNLVRAIALRVGLTPEMIEVFGARAKSGVPKTIFKMRDKKSDLFEEFINLGTLQQIPENVSQQSKDLNDVAAAAAAEAEAEAAADAAEAAAAVAAEADAEADAATAAEAAEGEAESEAAEAAGAATVGGGITRKIIDTILKPYRGLMRQTAVDLVNTNNLVRLIAYQLGMSPEMISEIAGYHNDPEGKHGLPKTYYKKKNKAFKDLFDTLPRVKDNKGSINIPDDALDITDSVTKMSD